jgi:predicted DNA-binding transcriptional regulator AlpA
MHISLASRVNPGSTNESPDETHPIMVSPERAMQILEMRLGINVGRSTFYRWIYTGRFFSIKLGGKLFIPLSEVEMVVQRLSHGERL